MRPEDGGINYFASLKHSETCVTGMVLSILAYFDFEDERLNQMVEHLLDQQMPDGGWNCQSYNGATHSSFHTTISVLEGWPNMSSGGLQPGWPRASSEGLNLGPGSCKTGIPVAPSLKWKK